MSLCIVTFLFFVAIQKCRPSTNAASTVIMTDDSETDDDTEEYDTDEDIGSNIPTTTPTLTNFSLTKLNRNLRKENTFVQRTTSVSSENIEKTTIDEYDDESETDTESTLTDIDEPTSETAEITETTEEEETEEGEEEVFETTDNLFTAEKTVATMSSEVFTNHYSPTETSKKITDWFISTARPLGTTKVSGQTTNLYMTSKVKEVGLQATKSTMLVPEKVTDLFNSTSKRSTPIKKKVVAKTTHYKSSEIMTSRMAQTTKSTKPNETTSIISEVTVSPKAKDIKLRAAEPFIRAVSSLKRSAAFKTTTRFVRTEYQSERIFLEGVHVPTTATAIVRTAVPLTTKTTILEMLMSSLSITISHEFHETNTSITRIDANVMSEEIDCSKGSASCEKCKHISQHCHYNYKKKKCFYSKYTHENEIYECGRRWYAAEGFSTLYVALFFVVLFSFGIGLYFGCLYYLNVFVVASIPRSEVDRLRNQVRLIRERRNK